MEPSTRLVEPSDGDGTIRDLAAARPPDHGTLLFGRYRPLHELGRGGMGVVLLAHDSVLDVSVALKLIPETVVRDTEGIVDLKKEVLRGMELTHPGIVRVFSFEQDAEAAVIVMEHIQGETLAQKKAQKPNRCFDCEEVWPWLEQLTGALDYAHREARIAHRDLKPGNLMITSTGRLKVADFGIASSLSDTMSRVSVRSDSAGTPPYMSPQQAMGERPTHLDDIYSLGATFYELLTGKPPFFRGNILAQVLQEEPVSMTQRRLELGVTGCAEIPPAWEKMIAACLSKNPEERPISGAVVLAMLTSPEPARVSGARIPAGDLRLETGPAAGPLQRVYPRPVPRVDARPDAALSPKQPSSMFRPVMSAWSVMVEGTGAVIGAVVGPLIKVALVIAFILGFVVLKQKWDTQKAEREALAAQQTEAAEVPEVVAAAQVAPPSPQSLLPPRSTALDRPPVPAPNRPANRPPPRKNP